MKAPTTQNKPGTAIALKLMAVFLFMVMAAMIKVATQSVPAGQAVFFRSLFAMPIIIAWIWNTGEIREALTPKNLTGHIWRGLFGTTAMALTFAGLALLPLPEVTAIGYATPMFTVILAAIMLGERVRLFRISAVALGLVGVMIVIWPRLSVDPGAAGTAGTIGALMVLGASILRALVQIHIRTLVKTEHTAAIVFYFSLTATVLSLFSLPFGWIIPSRLDLMLLIGAGLIGGVAQILVTSSFRFGAASMLAPFDYASLIFAALIGYVIFSELPTSATVIGASLVVLGGAIILWRERQLGGGRNRARAVTDPKG
ncbi:DMT family transporter [uncultured Tateyamaria sp.]|uniref:DMT family transporter n=1 Tax=uncultured Tateyamaria sp. TaxID=455651 RepID=UPI001D284BE2|nr:DMT family transporter [uncultured Tateyamaria sp.]MCB4379221.1 DMT family transporter [Synechococcus sp. MU1644]